MSDDDGPSLSIPDFCAGEGFSRSFFFKLERKHLGPETYSIPGTRIRRITARARREWRARMVALSKEREAQLEHERRVAQTRAAGRAAVASPAHISHRRRRQ
jgi:hypothetical protein